MLRKWLPKTLKNKLFAAFLILIIIPLLIISLYGFGRVEQVLEEKSIEQSKREVADIQRSVVDLIGMISSTQISLRQNPSVEAILKELAKDNAFQRRRELEAIINSYSNSFFLSTPPVYITLVDLNGNVYHTFTPLAPIKGEHLMEEVERLGLSSSNSYYVWLEEANYLHELSGNSDLLTMVSLLIDEEGEPYGIARISMDHQRWFEELSEPLAKDEQMYIVDADGEVVFNSNQGIEPSFKEFISNTSTPNAKQQVTIDNANKAIYTTSYVRALNWTIIKQVPFRVVYSEVLLLRRSFLYTFLIVTVTFIGVSLLISDTITKPVRLLQKKMREVTNHNLKVTLSESGFHGEMLDLAVSFNRMIRDLNEMVHRLRMEERTKEWVRFQVLHSQMNPHFLLNTLNTLKSQSVKHQDDTSFRICVALGTLLEASLNVEVDMIRLEEEMELVQAYVNIQNFRFSNRYALFTDISEELSYALVPKFSIQPLVENAIVHGFSRMKNTGNIRIKARAVEGMLDIEILDDGIGLKKADERKLPRKRKGIGITNIQERLNLLFKQNASLTVEQADKGTLARLRMPLLVAKPYDREGGSNHVEGNSDRG